MKILCIIRTSTLQQELDSQHSEMETFCHSIGYRDIVWIEAKGASARSLNKAYLDMLEKVKTTILNDKEINAVGLWHLNRLGRKENYIVDMKSWFIENHIDVFIKNPNIRLFKNDGTVDQASSIIINLLAASIEFDTAELMAKTKRGKEHNKEIGKWNGGAFGTLYGYKVDPNGFVSRDEAEVYIINSIFEDYATGKYSYSTLAKEYRDRGITHRNKRINDTFIKKVLSEERYVTGTPRFEPIIDNTLYNKVKSIKEKNISASGKSHRRILMGTGILKCRICGHGYTANQTAYVCYENAKSQRFNSKCESPTIAIDVMDRILLHVARIQHSIYLSTPDTEAINKEHESLNIVYQKIEASENEYKHLNESFERLRELFIDGQIDRKKYDSKASDLKERQKALNEARVAYNKEVEAIKGRIHTIENPDFAKFNDIFMDLYFEDNRKYLKEIVNQHIKAAYIEKSRKNGKMCIKITVETYESHIFTFFYYYTKSKEEVYREMAACAIKI